MNSPTKAMVEAMAKHAYLLLKKENIPPLF